MCSTRSRIVVLLSLTIAGCVASAPRTSPIVKQRVGEIFIFRGFTGIWSRGLDAMAVRFRQDGIETSIWADSDWQRAEKQIIAERREKQPHEPLVLLGHSFGADSAIRLADMLRTSGISVDLLVTIECVTPPPVPGNVKSALNIYRPRPLDFLPWWRGVPVQQTPGSHGTLQQINITRDRPDIDRPDLGHSDMDKDPKIQELVAQRVLAVCHPSVAAK